MSLTKKDLIALADVVRNLRTVPVSLNDKAQPEMAVRLDDLMDALVYYCANSNPRFKADRWREYVAGKCGPNGGRLLKGKRVSESTWATAEDYRGLPTLYVSDDSQ